MRNLGESWDWKESVFYLIKFSLHSPLRNQGTLALQIADVISHQLSGSKKVLYVSGEESVSQISARVHRIKGSLKDKHAFSRVDLWNEPNLTRIMEVLSPNGVHGALVIDSIQAVYVADVESEAGGMTQINACAKACTRLAKYSGFPVLLIG